MLRFNSKDVVRSLPQPPTCAMRHLPATSNLLGKLALAARHTAGWTFPRQVLEAVEAVEMLPLPARCGFWPEQNGVLVEVATAGVGTGAQVRRALERSLEEHGVPLRGLVLVNSPAELRQPLPLRCDLRDGAFGRAVPMLVGS